MSICLRLNQCISSCLILLSATWFVFVIVINNRAEDPRINSLNLMTPISQQFSDGIYLRKIQLHQQYLDLNSHGGDSTEQLNIFQLIQIMNDDSPNILGDEAILIVSITNQKLDLSSIKFAEYLYNRNGPIHTSGAKDKTKRQSEEKQQNKQIPIYILRQTEPVLLNNEKYLLSYKRQIQQTLKYFVNILDIKKLSLLSYQIGALLTLYALALQKNAKIFNSLSKVVLINPFNLSIKIFNSPPITFVEEYIKPAILQNDQKFNLFNNLRLILISTTRTVFQQSKVAEQYFSFSYKKAEQEHQVPLPTPNSLSSVPYLKATQSLYRFDNTFTISTRAMSNVFCFFDKQIYFFYEPFVSLLSKFFIQDSKDQFSQDEIQYYFHYKQLPQVKQLSQKTKRKYISKCIDFNLQRHSYDGNTFGGQGRQQEQCIRLLRKQSIYFEQSSILLYSKQRFQVYGQNFQKIYPFESKTSYMVYHIQRVNEFRRLFIINRRSVLIHMKIAPILVPSIASLHSQSVPPGGFLDLGQLGFQNLTNFQVIRTCEPANLIFPLHFAKMARSGQHSLFLNKNNNAKNCFIQYDNYDFYPDWFMLNWNILRNVMIFTLFVSYVLQRNLASRFFTQNFVNQMLVWVSTGSLLLFQNFIVLSTLCVFQTVIKYLMVGMEYLSSVRRIVVRFMWLPVLLQLASIYYPTVPSSWKALFLLLGLSTSKHNIYIIIIKLSFIVDSIKFDTGNLKGIISICLWTYIGAFENSVIYKNTNLSLKKIILDMCFLFSIGICINQEGSVIDEIINAYIVLQTILYLNNKYF